MDMFQLFHQRREVLYDFYLDDIWQRVPADLMRQRPHPRVNSIAWNLWHLTRAEDAGFNRFIADRPQVLDDGQWMARMNAPWRHHGSGMTFAEVDELSQQIDLAALQAYSVAVQARTRAIVAHLDVNGLEATLDADRLRRILVDEGLAHSHADALLQNYLGWTKGRCLMTYGLTHPFQHLGEIEVIASLLGVDLE
jgi:hypothetical protein